MKAIVLSGGGGKGAYQIGVWKALRHLDYDYEIVTGTSVGALNGAYLVQKEYLKAMWLWRNMNFNLVFDNQMTDDVNTPIGKKKLIKEYAKGIALGGMNPINLEKLITRTLNKKKFYESSINYGLVTVKLPLLKPKTLVKREIPKNRLIDYLMASAACYPAFKVKEIDNMSFIDGGYYDNLPINLAIDMGATEIVAVDLRAIGRNKKVKNDTVKITTISPRNNIGSFLVFDSNVSRRAMRIGYNDTMKTFKRLDGDKYTFKSKELSKNNQRYGIKISEKLNFIFTTKTNTLIGELLKNKTYKKIVNSDSLLLEEIFNKNIEYLGKIFNIDDSRIYKMSKYNKLLKEKIDEVEDLDIKLIEIKIKSNDIKSLLNSTILIKYIYNKLLEAKTNKDKKELQTIAILFQKEFVGALYLSVIK